MASIADGHPTQRRPGGGAAAAEEEASVHGMLLTSASVLPMVLHAAIELDVLEIIARSGPAAQLSAAEVAAQLPTTNPAAAAMLDRMFRLLATYPVLTCSLRPRPDGGAERLYGLAPVSKLFTRNSQGVSLAPYSLLIQSKVYMESWYHLKDAVLEGGIPFNKAYGMTPFEYQVTDPIFNKVFHDAMSSSTLIMNRVLEIYKGFEGVRSFVDVGGGVGTVSSMVVTKHPHIKAVNFDLPHVIQNAPAHPGVQHVPGDMFVTVPKGEIIFLNWICHDWDDEDCLKLLRNCYKNVPENGKVVVVESMLPESPETTGVSRFVTHKDLVMLLQHPGKERTQREFEGLAKGAGFIDFQVACRSDDTAVIEFFKKLQ